MSNNAAIEIARMVNDLRFQCFPYVSEDEKSELFFKLLRVPLNPAVLQTIGGAVQSNQWMQLKRFMRALKKHKMFRPLDHLKDNETIKGLYFSENDETFANELLRSLHGFTIESAEDKVLWDSVINLLFSATCHQDKVAALFLLATK